LVAVVRHFLAHEGAHKAYNVTPEPVVELKDLAER